MQPSDVGIISIQEKKKKNQQIHTQVPNFKF